LPKNTIRTKYKKIKNKKKEMKKKVNLQLELPVGSCILAIACGGVNIAINIDLNALTMWIRR